MSEELRLEIDERESKVNGTEARIVFKNTSIIKVVTASDSARGKYCPHDEQSLCRIRQEIWKAKSAYRIC